MQVQDIKIKIMHEVYTAYVSSIKPCLTLQDMIQPSKLMIEQVVELIMPGTKVQFNGVNEMPQDQLLEESKDDVSLEEKMLFWVQKLTISMEKKAQNSVLQL
jgi:hypothetical protein